MSGQDPLEHLYAYRPQRQEYRARRISIRTILLVVVLLLVVVVWVAYPRGAERYQDVNLPYVRADHSPYKVRPTDPGGEYIPHQDSMVFEPLESVPEKVVESILPGPEEPIDREDIADAAAEPESEQEAETGQTESLIKPPSLNLDVKLTEEAEKVGGTKPKLINVEQELKKQDERKQQTDVPPEEKVIGREMPATENVAKPSAKPAPALLERPKDLPLEGQSQQAARPDFNAPKKTTSPSATSGGLYYVQLGAFKDKPSAEQEYRKKILTFGDLISDLHVNYEYADLGAKGVYFRVKLGPMAETPARRLCQKMLDIKPGACFVTK